MAQVEYRSYRMSRKREVLHLGCGKKIALLGFFLEVYGVGKTDILVRSSKILKRRTSHCKLDFYLSHVLQTAIFGCGERVPIITKVVFVFEKASDKPNLRRSREASRSVVVVRI